MVRTSARPKPAHCWRLETVRLEDRSVPAGNVLADQAGAALTLIGDDLGNQVRVLPGSQPNEVVVHGDGTTINGSSSPQVFTGVENIIGHMLLGNDSLRLIGVHIDTDFSSLIFVDGNGGNDRIEVIDSTIDAVGLVDVQIYGERVFPTFHSGTSGNDTIGILNSDLLGTLVSVRLVGETNDGGAITGGNDDITIADSRLIAAGGFFHQVAVDIFGDINTALGGQTSTIGGGNDTIAIRDTEMVASSELFNFSFQNSVSVNIVGDFNNVTAFDPQTGLGVDATGTIGGGNDTIRVTNTTQSVRGVNFGTSQNGLRVAGDANFVGGMAGATTVGTIGGGNDTIEIRDSALSTTDGPTNGSFVEVRGDDVQAGAPEEGGTTARIGGGNDRIDIVNTPIFGGPPGGSALVVFGESISAFGPVGDVVGVGNDRINILNLTQPAGAANDSFGIFFDAGIGDDRVEISNTSAFLFNIHLGDGDDTLTFNANSIGGEASLDGGPGFDRLTAAGNTGLLISFNFEEEEIS